MKPDLARVIKDGGAVRSFSFFASDEPASKRRGLVNLAVEWPSQRRKPVSSRLIRIDSGFRRNDEITISALRSHAITKHEGELQELRAIVQVA